MSRLRRNHVRTLTVFAVSVAITAGTVLVMSLPSPETRRVSSADKVVRIDGAWRPGAPAPAIAPLPGSLSFLRGPAYRISAAPAPEGVPYRLTFRVPAELVGQAPTLYRFTPELDAWQAYPSVPSADGWSLTTPVGQLPLAAWGVGLSVRPARPLRAADVLSGLVAAPPPGAVGYEAYDASVDADGEAVLLSDPLDAGGCGGTFRLGAAQTKTSRDLPQGAGAYRVLVRWQVGGGCPAGETVSSAHRVP